MNQPLELFIAIYTDEDVSRELANELHERGFRAQSAIEAGLLGADDDVQLDYAIANQMTILTYNRQHFMPLATRYASEGKHHFGIVISTKQFSDVRFGELLRLTLRLLNSLSAEEMIDRVVYLQEFEQPT